MKKSPRRRYVLAGLLAAIIASAGFAFAAANTVNGSYAGDGSGTVSGFVASNISWDLNDANPLLVDDVTFDLDQTANEVRVRVSESGVDTAWTAPADCTNGGGNTWTCDLTGLSVDTDALDGLEVASAS
jgi:hypothetical protein